jgi:hypothetical protein
VFKIYLFLRFTEKLLVTPDAGLFFFINQGVLTVDSINDQEEMQTMEVKKYFLIYDFYVASHLTRHTILNLFEKCHATELYYVWHAAGESLKLMKRAILT